MSSHRKIITVKVKVIVDIDTSDIEESRNTDAYTEQVDEKVQEFIENTDYDFGNTEGATVYNTEILSYTDGVVECDVK